jgi:site-specific DNA-methyltransferase (adenine-specific)
VKPYYEDERAGITIWHADCRDVLPTLADRSVDLVLTDPPYDEQTHSRGGNVRRTDGGPAIAQIPFAALLDPIPIATEITRVCSRWAMVFCAVRQIERWSAAIEAQGWRVPRVMIWVKPDASPQFSVDRPGHGYESIVLAHPVGKTRWNGGGHKGVFTHNRIDRESGFHHPTQKPISLFRELITLFSDPGDLVLDPFAGSGTTARACKDLGRRCIAIEQNEQYAEIAVRRLAQEVMPLEV